MGPAYYISHQNPPDTPREPTDVPGSSPEPGLPPSGPVEEPPMSPPGTDIPPGTSTPTPLRL